MKSVCAGIGAKTTAIAGQQHAAGFELAPAQKRSEGVQHIEFGLTLSGE